ncbi:hypothetical protein [Ferroplasma sp.]
MYRAEGASKYCVKVNPKNTSKRFSSCGNIVEVQIPDNRKYHCSNCE